MSATSKPAPSGDVESLFTAPLSETDPEIAEAIRLELGRQRDEIELIASENIVSRAVLEAQGSVLTNKYAEGYPGRRYYGGCQFVDIAERLAIDRANSCSAASSPMCSRTRARPANAAVFFALMQPGDTFMGLNLAAGGHLTPRHADQYVRQVVQAGALRRAARQTSASTMDEVAQARARAQAESDHRRRLGLSAHHRLQRVPRDRRRSRRAADGGHGAFRRTGGGRRASLAVPARACGDDDDAQDAARPARRRDPHQ